MEHTDILVAGGGIAGLSAAVRLGVDGRGVTLVDPAPAEAGAGHDLRTTAFLQPAIATLTLAGAWAAMQAAGAELRTMRIVDAGGRVHRPRATADFTGAETGHGLFGWNVPNRAARRALLERLAQMPNVRLRQGTAVERYLPRLDAALVRLSDGGTLAAKLVVAADGREFDAPPAGRHSAPAVELWPEGAGLRRHASRPARGRLDRDPPHRRTADAGADAGPAL